MTESPPLGRMTNSALLPGEHPGIDNAIGWRDQIVLAYLAYDWCFDESVPEALTTAQREFLRDVCEWDGSHELGSPEAVAMLDRISDWANSSALGAQLRSGWYGYGEEPEPDEYRITLSVGGPTLTLEGDLDGCGSPCTAQLRYSWYSSSECLPVIESEAEALTWFAQRIVQA